MHILYTSVHPAAAAPTVPGGSDHVWRAPRLPHCKQWELAGPFCSVTAKKQKHKITTKKYQCNVLGRQMTNETNKTFYSFLKKTHGMNLFFFLNVKLIRIPAALSTSFSRSPLLLINTLAVPCRRVLVPFQIFGATTLNSHRYFF